MIPRIIGALQALALVLAMGAAMPHPAAALEVGTSAVVVMYHRFGDGRHPSTNITLEQFEAHLAELTGGAYHVLPLPEILAAIREGRPLPERTVGITIDDAFSSVYREAWPRLRAAGLPFTLFVSTGPVDSGAEDYMSWNQLRELAVHEGVTIGHHSHDHVSFVDIGVDGVRRQLAAATARFEAELKAAPEILAYPYGEAGQPAWDLVREAGFTAAFGQHSGAFGPAANRLFLPRFALNETYGDMDRFRLAVNALPLPVTDVSPADPVVTGANPPAIGFTVGDGVQGLDRLACFASHEGRAELLRLGDRRIEVRLKSPLPKGRTRLNCTLPTRKGRWRWYGRMFLVGAG